MDSPGVFHLCMATDLAKLQGVRVERILINAEMARKLLACNIENNRPINERRVRDFSRDMRNGHWMENGETLIFTGSSIDSPGTMLDGQHRLMACRECGVSFWCLIAWGVSMDAFLTIDRGQIRSTGQILRTTKGVGDYNAVAATLSYLFRFREGIIMPGGSNRPTSTETAELLDHNPGIVDSVKEAQRVIHNFPAGPVSAIAICHYLFSRQDAVLAETFFDSLAMGASLRSVDPVYQLRNRIITASAQKFAKRIQPYELLALMFKTWIAEREGRTMSVLRWSMAESFPNIGPVDSIYKIKITVQHPEKSHNTGRRKPRVTAPAKIVESAKKSKLDTLVEQFNSKRLN